MPEIARGDAKRPVDEDVARVAAKLPKYPGVGRLERFPVAGPGKAHGRPRAAVFVLACTNCNWTFVGTEAALEQHERDGSVAPHMPEMEAEVAAPPSGAFKMPHTRKRKHEENAGKVETVQA